LKLNHVSATSCSAARARAQALDNLAGFHSDPSGAAGWDFFIHLESRRVDIAGITVHPDERWTQQIARNVTMCSLGVRTSAATGLFNAASDWADSLRYYHQEAA
jgi:hypothetical protein